MPLPIVDSFITQLRRTAKTNDTFVASTVLADAKFYVHIRKVAAMNQDTDGKLVLLGVRVGTTDLYLKTVTLTTKTHYYLTELNIYVPSYYRFICKCLTPTANDRYYINVYGTRHVEKN